MQLTHECSARGNLLLPLLPHVAVVVPVVVAALDVTVTVASAGVFHFCGCSVRFRAHLLD